MTDYPSWNPSTTFSGGSVSNAPPAINNSIQLQGGSSLTETLTFSSPVLNPIMAIWSLGAPGNQASFVFTGSEPFTLEAGGPSAEYGGTSITVSGNSVLGAEGNGVIQFNGTFSALTWTAAFASIVPPSLPNPRVIVYLSGVAEIAGAVGLLIPKLRSWARWGLILLLICVFPANLYMARAHIQMPRHTIPEWALWARLPLQGVLICWIWWCSGPRKSSLDISD